MKYLLIILSILFISCDKCKDNNCQNDSICIDGGCDCLDGYSGIFCEVEDNPKYIEITSVVLHSYPELNAEGEPWDNTEFNTGNADIFLGLRDSTGFPLNYFNEGTIEDAEPNTDYTFTPAEKVWLKHDAKYILRLSDYDYLGIVEIIFNDEIFLYNKGNGFPNSINFDNYTINLSYIHY